MGSSARSAAGSSVARPVGSTPAASAPVAPAKQAKPASPTKAAASATGISSYRAEAAELLAASAQRRRRRTITNPNKQRTRDVHQRLCRDFAVSAHEASDFERALCGAARVGRERELLALQDNTRKMSRARDSLRQSRTSMKLRWSRHRIGLQQRRAARKRQRGQGSTRT